MISYRSPWTGVALANAIWLTRGLRLVQIVDMNNQVLRLSIWVTCQHLYSNSSQSTEGLFAVLLAAAAGAAAFADADITASHCAGQIVVVHRLIFTFGSVENKRRHFFSAIHNFLLSKLDKKCVSRLMPAELCTSKEARKNYTVMFFLKFSQFLTNKFKFLSILALP